MKVGCELIQHALPDHIQYISNHQCSSEKVNTE